MHHNTTLTWICMRLLLFIAIFSFGIACTTQDKKNADTTEQQTYTCPMHPQIVQYEPSTCPICHMDLVPFDRNNQDEFLTLGPEQIALANIKTLVVGDTSGLNSRNINGRLVINPEQTVIVSSRVPGRIERLYFRETGVALQKGQPMYQIYSENLMALQQEYLLALDQVEAFPQNETFREILSAAEKRLLLLDQTPTQISALKRTKTSAGSITYYAPAGGIVAAVNTIEGQYVEEGSTILTIEGYSTLWVEADARTAELNGIKAGDRLPIIVSGYENIPATMTVSFIEPEFRPGSRYITLRGEARNPDNRLKPGMQVTIQLPGKAHADRLRIPANAIIHHEKSSHVWVETAEGIFEPRRVRTGEQDAGQAEIIEGLEAGEKLVVQGAYLLYSEYVLKKGDLAEAL